jgi:hypothetical protein
VRVVAQEDGHLHHRALPILREIVTSLPKFGIEQDRISRGCTLGKHAKVAFPSSTHRSKKILDLVHSVVCGPMSVASITRSMYYVSFIHELSCKTGIYFLNTKDEVFSGFQEFKALFENQTGKKIKVLRSDNGGEYNSIISWVFARRQESRGG